MPQRLGRMAADRRMPLLDSTGVGRRSGSARGQRNRDAAGALAGDRIRERNPIGISIGIGIGIGIAA
jgi:hypothetical protein